MSEKYNPKMCSVKCARWACLFGAIVSLFTSSLAFAPAFTVRNVLPLHKTPVALPNGFDVSPRSIQLYSSSDDEDVSISESDQGILGAIGCAASLTAFYSEFVLVNTGCGLPAGPIGLAEGLSYLIVIGIVKFSLFTKKTTVSSSRMADSSYCII